MLATVEFDSKQRFLAVEVKDVALTMAKIKRMLTPEFCASELAVTQQPPE
jgi:hypothetical protein